jgi:hypothetical protein
MGSPAPAAVPLSPEQCLDRVRQTILRASSEVDALTNLEQYTSLKLNRVELLLRDDLITFVEERLTELCEVLPDLLRLVRSLHLSAIDACFVTNVIGKCDACEAAVRTLASVNEFALLRDKAVGEVN